MGSFKIRLSSRWIPAYDGRNAGLVWSNGLGREVRGVCEMPAQAISFDEVVLILRKDSGIRFDEQLPGFHLYGTDIVQ